MEAQSLCSRFVQGPLPAERWREAILADMPHILIYPEVGMGPVAAQLAAQRLAPTQCNFAGHPETSGYPTLDYFLSSELMEPPDGQEHYTERLIRLPNMATYYEPVVPQPEANGIRELRMAIDGAGFLVRSIAVQILAPIRCGFSTDRPRGGRLPFYFHRISRAANT